MQTVFLSGHNFISNEGNKLIYIFLKSNDIAAWNKVIIKKFKKMENGSENFQLFIDAFSEKTFYITRKLENICFFGLFGLYNI